jgi:hypothetical protein
MANIHLLLQQAARSTFARRSSVLPRGLPVALTNEFAANTTKLTQWRAFCRRDTRTKAEVSLGEVVEFIGMFLLPPLEALAAESPCGLSWSAGGPWR